MFDYAELERLLGADQVTREPAQLREFGRDWTKYLEPRPVAITFPRSTDDVVALVRFAREYKMALVPSGGRTGLSGGAVATNGEIVVSFAKMNRILEFDAYDQTLTVEAGVVTEAVQKFAENKGLQYPVDFAATGSSQIGGNVATNAGGIKVLRYGLTRSWVAGLEAVSGTGHVLKLGRGLVKNATGYDLRHLLIGSEGTLALITHVTLNLAPPPAPLNVFVFGVTELDHVMRIYHAFKKAVPLTAFEMFTELALETVLNHHSDLKRPFSDAYTYYVVAEFETPSEATLERALEVFGEGLEDGWIADGVQAQSPTQARDLWRLREDISESVAPFQPYKNDISVRIAQVPEFLRETDAILRQNYPDFRVVWFGHIGDGNLHVNILRPSDMAPADFLAACKRVDEQIFGMIERFGGSVSAEHGVGLMKKPYLGHTRAPVEVDLMRGIKRVFDPDNVLNPGKIF